MPKKTTTKKKTTPPVSAAVQRHLDSAAKEINVRLAKAEQADGKAQDHRLAAALKLAGTKTECKDNKINFQKWCEKHIDWSYENARKLVRIGEADNPKQALEDLRVRNALVNKEHRERKKVTAATSSSPPSANPMIVASTALDVLDDTQAVTVLDEAANKRGLAILSHERAKRVMGDDEMSALARAKFAFDDLEPSGKLALLAYATESTGAETRLFDQPIAEVVAAQQGKATTKGAGKGRKRGTKRGAKKAA